MCSKYAMSRFYQIYECFFHQVKYGFVNSYISIWRNMKRSSNQGKQFKENSTEYFPQNVLMKHQISAVYMFDKFFVIF